MKAHFFILLMLGFTFKLKAQVVKHVSISETDLAITIDGILDEPIWQTVEVADDFQQSFPTDTLAALAKTEIRFTYDKKYLYISAICYNSGADASYVTPSLRRDFRGAGNDMFVIHFDTFDDKTNAFQFGINPYGVRREGLVSNGGGQRGDLSLDWENKWIGETTMQDGYWIAEMAIPFKSIRFKEGNTSWNFNAYRIDSNTGERSTWNPIPRNFVLYSLAHTGQLNWDKPLNSPGANIAVIPYLSTNASASGGYTDPDDGPISRSSKSGFDAGFDAKIGLGPALNLDLTVNPDFSQVEVDQQVTNLDRFEIFFPERRQFFLENADLFAQFGDRGLRPFFSRRIGVSRDESTGQNVENPIRFGARLSGKVNNNLRLGILNMQAAAIEDIDVPEINYTVAVLQQKIFSRSNLSFIFVNKQDLENTNNPTIDQYNRTLGVDYNIASRDNKLTGKVFYHQSFDKENPESAYAIAARLQYSTVPFEIEGAVQLVGENYNPEVGFVRRTDYSFMTGRFQKNFYPSSNVFQRLNPQIEASFFTNPVYGTTDSEINLGLGGQLLNTGRFEIGAIRQYTYLFNDFDPTRQGNQPLPSDTDYTYIGAQGNYSSDTRKKFYYNANAYAGEYFNGTRLTFGGRLNYRFQPYGIVSMDFAYNKIRLPEPYGDADLLLFGPRFDITFSKSLFWTTFIQYNSQIENVNINSRLQWRFAPVSDLFIAYTDNYFPDDFINKNRSVVIKMTYWLNF
jgi:hypothetical protein